MPSPDAVGEALPSDPAPASSQLHSKDAAVAAEGIAAELGGIPAKSRHTITHDSGGEFAWHQAAKDEIGLRADFCNPHSPWQRGSIENVNSGATFPEKPEKPASENTPIPTSRT